MYKYLLFCLFVALSFKVDAQSKFNNFEEFKPSDSIPGFVYFDHVYQPDSIKKSTFDVEIRLVTYYHHFKTIFILTKKKGAYKADFYRQRYQIIHMKPGANTTGFKYNQYVRRRIVGNLDSVYNELLKHKILVLDSRKGLTNPKYDRPYVIEWKKNSQTKRYSFRDFTFLAEDFPRMKTVKNYEKIVEIINRLLFGVVQ